MIQRIKPVGCRSGNNTKKLKVGEGMTYPKTLKMIIEVRHSISGEKKSHVDGEFVPHELRLDELNGA
jgi:hypothetical protein